MKGIFAGQFLLKKHYLYGTKYHQVVYFIQQLIHFTI